MVVVLSGAKSRVVAGWPPHNGMDATADGSTSQNGMRGDLAHDMGSSMKLLKLDESSKGIEEYPWPDDEGMHPRREDHENHRRLVRQSP